MTGDYLINITELHTTPLGMERIRQNLSLPDTAGAVDFCRSIILDDSAKFERMGKNWYVASENVRITVNAHSNTIITAHKIATSKC